MADWMILIAAGVVAIVSLAWLALAMDGHWWQVHGGSSPSQLTQTLLRVLGASGIVVSGTLCFIADRPSMAALLWIMLMAFAAVSIALTLAWKPALLRFAWTKSGSSAGRRIF
jgi:hypothetical protein